MLKFGAHAVFGGGGASVSSSEALDEWDDKGDLNNIDIGIPLTDMSKIVDRDIDWSEPKKTTADFMPTSPASHS